MKINTDPKKIEELLTRGVEEVIDKENLRKKLLSGKKLRVKLGIDPTSPNIHIGRSIPLLKLRDFQELGHQLVFIIGDFTGVVGDTSDKDSERPMLSKEKVRENMKDYIKQAAKIIDMDKCEARYNSEWLAKLGYWEISNQADNFSLAEFIARENIHRRLDASTRVSLRELLYPLMQGYDSVAVKADVEIGGTDQRFNLLAGRTLQGVYKQEAQDIIMGPLLEGTDGRKMSSSWGNTIDLSASANDMFGKVMSISDDFIVKYFILATRVSLEAIELSKKELADGANPRDLKIKLAHEIVKMYHSEKFAQEAQEYFISTFSKRETPSDIPAIKPSSYDIITILVESKICASKGDARRQIEQGGVKVNGIRVETQNFASIKKGDVVQKGSRFFVRVK
ncbi:MAG: tyrosine--tRNA ligase [Candidatus Magasanikbacteria bacterium RIFCSPLOWO2_01_FULL_43_20b]|uniref:Tyrosine--tRNA ligase n=1 Tax=Candidatus Magasanikbacteria bacterium RIFCSPLOWO2_12_FULL_43_12 TaxID=1798692 RepID=A0A1F6MRG1_9BACT|nr:MAG: tyrosine--tRNA ligase [Candidatus Magasanikbacteria bacterium RIFCSPHIGHO2_02_FULL_44_13]OGH72149.1 MAG: tyrosine--tRNA ligase [Candidatus Magasanikbacteria bacterium RIFCSPLOWO2_02_FULL_43_22]OGH73474.1 MAG: tyrosine--tRNA ligase [Candidatus Magasanikbacteria bacterium RIFCSPLOWO2_01_FULL_43_20b]OGH74255.1 MAG: tyrosine--tRNA ligase [Candidatus Magasanikbacteria bacterium RIFCSPLOWO2_12_FULL_43_12]